MGKERQNSQDIKGAPENKMILEDYYVSVASPEQAPTGMMKVGKPIADCGTISHEEITKLWNYMKSEFKRPQFRDAYNGNIQLFDYILEGQLKIVLSDDKPIGFVKVNDNIDSPVFDPSAIIAKRALENSLGENFTGEIKIDGEIDELKKAREDFLSKLNARYSNLKQGKKFQFEIKDLDKKGFKVIIYFEEDKEIKPLGEGINVKYRKIDQGMNRVLSYITRMAVECTPKIRHICYLW
ncbi:MAG: hypothetical protein COU31_02590 [Candidatus Magasanikbacteria bacterium CG10_big_fil_rev_8_21_14_0_10_40_10]|uniref:Uncharacterized protein n=1 Tax=Candidatus Magasanikbacteria bacterium CG10_big_fil_rev_8_21_14_0_10_40_10 TaxID=1974648 RepID=A0A2M6W3S9_9BACT|nr:MAG: hypothetical protein COU31_02590 [Candidatus Magasanikbacteria bacterium CG10_big_fil_rev_8_21_14_0_10_40_10]